MTGNMTMARERIYLFDTTLRDGQQTAARPHKRSAGGRAKEEAGVCGWSTRR
jgi:hypothetical protein